AIVLMPIPITAQCMTAVRHGRRGRDVALGKDNATLEQVDIEFLFFTAGILRSIFALIELAGLPREEKRRTWLAGYKKPLARALSHPAAMDKKSYLLSSAQERLTLPIPRPRIHGSPAPA